MRESFGYEPFESDDSDDDPGEDLVADECAPDDPNYTCPFDDYTPHNYDPSSCSVTDVSRVLYSLEKKVSSSKDTIPEDCRECLANKFFDMSVKLHDSSNKLYDSLSDFITLSKRWRQILRRSLIKSMFSEKALKLALSTNPIQNRFEYSYTGEDYTEINYDDARRVALEHRLVICQALEYPFVHTELFRLEYELNKALELEHYEEATVLKAKIESLKNMPFE
jgi:hypothetical protein